MELYGNNLRYDGVNVGGVFRPITVPLTEELISSYQGVFGETFEECPRGLLLLHRFLYGAINGQFPDGNLHTRLQIKINRPLIRGETFTVQGEIKDKFVKKEWCYLVIRTRWTDATGASVAVIDWTYAIEKRAPHGKDS